MTLPPDPTDEPLTEARLVACCRPTGTRSAKSSPSCSSAARAHSCSATCALGGGDTDISRARWTRGRTRDRGVPRAGRRRVRGRHVRSAERHRRRRRAPRASAVRRRRSRRSSPAPTTAWSCCPGSATRALAYDPRADRRRHRDSAARSRSTCVLEVDTGTGSRLVHVEPGPPARSGAAFTDPRDPNDRPLAVHIVREIGAGARGGRRERTRGSPASTISSTAARRARSSRRGLAYRRLAAPVGVAARSRAGRAGGVLVVLRAHRPPHRTAARSRVSSGCSVAGSCSSSRSSRSCSCSRSRSCTTRSAGVAWWGPQPRGNDDARGEAVTLAAAGGVGLVTAHTRRPELTDLGGGSFYANCGSGGPGRRARRARAGGLPAGVRRAAALFVGRARSGRGAARAALARRARPPELERGSSGSRRATGCGPRGRPRSSPSIPGTVTWPSAGDATARPPPHPAHRGDRDRVGGRAQPGVGRDGAAREPVGRARAVRADRGAGGGGGARRVWPASASCSSRAAFAAASATRGRSRSRCCSLAWAGTW